jgi:hypothetical protein
MGLVEANDGLSPLVELASGVDALYASSKTTIPPKLFDELLALRQLATDEELPVDWQLGTVKFQIFGHAWGLYPVLIVHEFGRFGFTQSEHVPGIRLQIQSSYLHAVGPLAALAWFTERLSELGLFPSWTLSRLDLFVDVQGWDLKASDKHRFLCRASQGATHDENDRLTGFSFGGRKTHTITARIYDKTLEIQKKKSDWVRDVWGDRFRPGETVWRIECEAHTKLLRELRITDVEDGLARQGELWAYFTDKWLTFRDPSEDGNKSRWPLSAVWREVQKASLRGDVIGLDRIRDCEAVAEMEKLIPALRGYMCSVGARLGCDDLWSVSNAVYEVLQHDEDRSGYSMESRIADRKRRLGQ